jgi:hypothetical protein
VSSYDVVSFFFLSKFVTIVSRFTFSSFAVKEEVTKDPCIAENKDPPNTLHKPCGMGALRCYVQLGILT